MLGTGHRLEEVNMDTNLGLDIYLEPFARKEAKLLETGWLRRQRSGSSRN